MSIRCAAGAICSCLLIFSGCTSPSTTYQRSGSQDAHKKGCTERPPASYTSSVENRLKVELPLVGKTEAQAEGAVKSYLEQKSGSTKEGKDLADYLFYICQTASNGNWSEATTEHLITLFVEKWRTEPREATASDSKCLQQLQSGYALKEKIDTEYSTTRKAGTFQSNQAGLVKKWAMDEREWEINTEAVLVDMGGSINRGHFRNAPISASRPQGNWEWGTITTQLQGKLIALEGICKEPSR